MRKSLAHQGHPKHYGAYLGYWIDVTIGINEVDHIKYSHLQLTNHTDKALEGLRMFVDAAEVLEESLWSV